MKSIFTYSIAFLFLIKLKFYGLNNFPSYIREKYGLPVLKQFRQYESASKKIRKTSLDLGFLRLCAFHDVIPKFIYFRLYRRSLYGTEFYADSLRKLLQLEIDHKQSIHRGQVKGLSLLRNDLSCSLGVLTFHYCLKFVSEAVRVYELKVESIHERKLSRLSIQSPRSCKFDDVVTNLSSFRLDDRLKFLLSLGLEFGIPCFKPNFNSYFLAFERLILSLKNIPVYKVSFDKVISSVKLLAHRSFYSKFRCVAHPFFVKSDRDILKKLSTNEELVISRPDKGRGVVILNKVDYVHKMTDILNDESKFVISDEEPFRLLRRLEDRLNYKLRTLKESGFLDKNSYDDLFSSSAALPVLYGLCKVHKNNFPLRPVLAAYNAHNYKLAKFLNLLIQPYVKDTTSVKNSLEFVNIITSNVNVNSYMVSYDVSSLFTSVPLLETISIIADLVYSSVTVPPPSLGKAAFIDLLKLATLDTHFLFNGQIYKQIDGVAMGSPLGPLFANVFLTHLESDFLRNQNIPQPSLYLKYVDDTFCLFENRSSAVEFFDYLNSVHEHISFTMEHESNRSISFLDVLVTRTDLKFSTSVYRKSTFTPLTVNFYSFSFVKYKLNSILTLINRAYAVSSDYISFDSEITFLSRFFKGNGFPEKAFFSILYRFLNGIFIPSLVKFDVPKDIRYFSFPYNGTSSLKLVAELKSLLSIYFPQISFRFCLANRHTIGSLFYFKDKIPTLMRSKVVYKFLCPSCKKASYIGSTSRRFRVRICEHLGVSYRTSKLVGSPLQSAVRDHSRICHADPAFSDFSILSSASDGLSLNILESLFIRDQKPSLNKDVSSFPLLIT